MQWTEIRQHYPQQWLLIEAIQAHSEQNKRILDDISVVGVYADSAEAMKAYLHRHRQTPDREFYVCSTNRPTLDITERHWLGIRGASA